MAEVLVTNGNLRGPNAHAILKRAHPYGPEVRARTVRVPLHDRVRIGTLRSIAEDAGANDCDGFSKWIDSNREPNAISEYPGQKKPVLRGNYVR